MGDGLHRTTFRDTGLGLPLKATGRGNPDIKWVKGMAFFSGSFPGSVR